MSSFPTTFTELTPVPRGISEEADKALARMHDKGFEVVTGFDPYYAGRMAVIGEQVGTIEQPGVKEFCPNDTKRFSENNAALWVAKGDKTINQYGRGMVLALDKNATTPENMPNLSVYTWTGPESPSLPKGTPENLVRKFTALTQGWETTFAIRVNGEYQGRGLAVPMTIVSVAVGNALFDAKDFWLETWGSNHAGPKVYAPAGWKKIELELETTRPSALHGKDVPDNRTYYGYPNELLPAHTA